MPDPQTYTIDFDDTGRWYVIPPEPEQRRIMCGDRRGALLTLVCIHETDDPAQEFDRIWNEVRAEQRCTEEPMTCSPN